MRNHAHVQIQYYRDHRDDDGDIAKPGDRILVESLIGVDPRNKDDRETLHQMLDEYLDQWIIPKLNKADEINPDLTRSDYKDTVNKEADDFNSMEVHDQIHFKIFAEIDCH